ncbi:MAG: amidohydrolase, partial [Xanthobacteraceae bacterium]
MAGRPAGARRGPAKLVTILLSHSIRGRWMDNRSDIWRGVDTIKERFIALSDRVWGMPEVCY